MGKNKNNVKKGGHSNRKKTKKREWQSSLEEANLYSCIPARDWTAKHLLSI
jgi:hypothetical protein